MTRHLILLTATALLVVACMLYPFFPGEYDGFAATLFAISHLIAFAGVLLVPLGAIWLALELRDRTRAQGGPSHATTRHRMAIASLAAATLVGIAASLIAFANIGRSLGLALILFCLWIATRLARKLNARRSAGTHAFNPVALYLVVLPLVALIAKFTLVGSASVFSRNRAIDNSAPMIADIERFREAKGHYPRSLVAVHRDYKPEVVGVERYHYEPSGDAYNLYFEHLAAALGTREFVMYNPRDEHEMTSHVEDLLTSTPAELALGRGYHAVHDAGRPHWKRFLFD